MQKSRALAIGAHVMGWLLFFSLVLAFTASQAQAAPDRGFGARFALFALTYLLVFYANAYFLFPRLYLRKKYGLYSLVTILLFAAIWWLRPFDRLQLLRINNGPSISQPMEGRPLPPPDAFGPGPGPGRPMDAAPRPGPEEGHHRPAFDIISLILFLMTWSASIALQVVRRWQLTERRATRAEADKANAELSFLKAQINPHFLFNTLNNIYSMALSRSEDTATAILKLSNIMRYVTDEVNQQFVPLQGEIDCAADYISLQRLRLSSRVPIRFTVSGDTQGRKIAPLVLMTFIENVFKYGVSSHEPAEIVITIDSGPEELRFFCSNRIFPLNSRLERAGIGIANTRARLERLYPGRHRLEITENGNFTVSLTLDTSA